MKFLYFLFRSCSFFAWFIFSSLRFAISFPVEVNSNRQMQKLEASSQEVHGHVCGYEPQHKHQHSCSHLVYQVTPGPRGTTTRNTQYKDDAPG
ncbi:hypothetical protein QZH41_019001, partial [Actinostola sp. cb2023]